MADIFVSYKRADSARVEPLVRMLERAGYSVWWDQGIEPGDEWFNRILDELERSRLTLGVWSKTSIDARGAFTPNHEGKYYVRIEHNKTKPGRLIPVLLDEERVALEFDHIQAVNLTSWRGQEHDAVCVMLKQRIDTLLGAPARPAPTAPHYSPGQVFRDGADLPEMVVIPPGRFLMGSPAHEKGRRELEGPQREVRIERPFALGKYAVTFAEWDAAISAGATLHRPNDQNWGRDRRPVVDVSWDDAQSFIVWLNTRVAAGGYRLPSEAEWEYACRAGTTTPYSTGMSISIRQAQFSPEGKPGSTQTAPVGSFPANALALHDMHGNVWEWVQDCHEDHYLSHPNDGSAHETLACRFRVYRGGSWAHAADIMRSANRAGAPPTYRGGGALGFRVARTI